ncbi:MAG: hypothetical protein COA58_04600 [Bacteroidetes bacterium]|nr:MAG: hypothetical protein COA58_04600 [Bacteroidota bacterium]
MKKIIILLFVLGFWDISLAQSFGAQLVLGANFSQVDGDQLGGYNKLGVNAGIQINREISDDWEAAFEIRYSMKGAKKVIDPKAPATFTLKLNYHYVEVPVLAKYKGFEKLIPFGGISIGINVLKERDENGITSKEPQLNATELGLILGISYQFNDRIAADLRHAYSLSSVRDAPIIINSPTVFGRAGWYNRLFTIGLNYRLKN